MAVFQAIARREGQFIGGSREAPLEVPPRQQRCVAAVRKLQGPGAILQRTPALDLQPVRFIDALLGRIDGDVLLRVVAVVAQV